MSGLPKGAVEKLCQFHGTFSPFVCSFSFSFRPSLSLSLSLSLSTSVCVASFLFRRGKQRPRRELNTKRRLRFEPNDQPLPILFFLDSAWYKREKSPRERFRLSRTFLFTDRRRVSQMSLFKNYVNSLLSLSLSRFKVLQPPLKKKPIGNEVYAQMWKREEWSTRLIEYACE